MTHPTRQAYFFNLLGYAVCFVNYRGSLGDGTDSIESIMGNIGDTDVKDCHAALNMCLSMAVVNLMHLLQVYVLKVA